MTVWDDLGFATNYTVEVDPEYPGDGQWTDARHGGLDAPVIARVAPRNAEPWLLAAELTDFAALYGTPSPNTVCLFVRFDRAVLIDAFDPSSETQVGPIAPLSAFAISDPPLLLLATETDVTAIGADGEVWKSEGLFSDDLRIRRTGNGRIVLRGRNYSENTPTELTLDAHTGHPVD